jgi:hypothetical protein
MKKGLLATICVMVLLAGCGGQPTKEPEPQETAITAEEMQAYLQELPEEVTKETAVSEGFYTIADGAVAGGQEAWDGFLQASEQGEAASVVICQYSMQGGAMLDYLSHQAEGGYLLVSDRTRDGYGEELEIEKQLQETFDCLNIFEDFRLEEGGQAYTICVLSNEPELDAETFRTYWQERTTEAHQTYLLFVI